MKMIACTLQQESPPQDQPLQQHLSQSSANLQQYSLNSQELDTTLKTLQKFKRIRKDRKLTNFKRKFNKLNDIFAAMSELFSKKKDNMSEVKKNKEMKEARKLENIRKRFQRFEEKKYDFMRKGIESIEEESAKQPVILDSSDENEPKLPYQSNPICYICRKKYTSLDTLYPKHCPQCALFSKEKRFQAADLSDFTALVTGGRIKIGYEIALKLLRDGAKVYVTSRFSHDAYIRYSKQFDFQNWKNRLFIIQCDFMSAVQVRALIETIKQNVDELNILINNAAQTIVRPKQFFAIQIQNQLQALPDNNNIVSANFPQLSPSHQFPSIQAPQPFLALQNSSENPNDIIDLNNLDQFGQPTDRRLKNTWTQKIQDTTLIDCLTTQTINSVVPFYLIGQLKTLMGKNNPGYIVNVSSMEGVFYRRYKSPNHAHTNMAKAALNMMTRTCALEFSLNNIYMNAVDTGWVTNENPYEIDKKMSEKYGFEVPLDCLEGAMRVLDPIYQGVRFQNFLFGKFLKDYKESVW